MVYIICKTNLYKKQKNVLSVIVVAVLWNTDIQKKLSILWHSPFTALLFPKKWKTDDSQKDWERDTTCWKGKGVEEEPYRTMERMPGHL